MDFWSREMDFWSLLCPRKTKEALLSVILGVYPVVKSLNHMVIPSLIFRGNSMWFSAAALPPYISTNNAQGFQFLCILSSPYFHFLPFKKNCHLCGDGEYLPIFKGYLIFHGVDTMLRGNFFKCQFIKCKLIELAREQL